MQKGPLLQHEQPPLDLPHSLYCPLGFNLFIDPVVASDGFTYERREIIQWFDKSDLSPMTGIPLQSTEVINNIVLKALAEEVLVGKERDRQKAIDMHKIMHDAIISGKRQRELIQAHKLNVDLRQRFLHSDIEMHKEIDSSKDYSSRIFQNLLQLKHLQTHTLKQPWSTLSVGPNHWLVGTQNSLLEFKNGNKRTLTNGVWIQALAMMPDGTILGSDRNKHLLFKLDQNHTFTQHAHYKDSVWASSQNLMGKSCMLTIMTIRS